MRRLLLYTLLILIPFLGYSQKKAPEENTRTLSFGLMAHFHGFGLEIQQMLKAPAGKFDYVIGASFTSFRNLKELKIESAYKDQGGKDYVYDKKNYGYVLAPTFGISKEFVPKNEFNRISIRGGLHLGPTLGLMKPYYIEVAIPYPNNPSQAYIDVSKYNGSLHNYGNIVGEADFFLGMNELASVVGLRSRATVSLDFSASRDYIRGLELGILFDFFSRDLELLDINGNKQVYLGGSVSLLIGNAW